MQDKKDSRESMDDFENIDGAESKGCRHVCSPEVRERYRIIKILGKGAEGTVYKAKDRKSGQYVAIKAVEENIKEFYLAKRILREIAILHHLSK
mmetsp:Transcript_8615/g.13346  ORF Transcript_8615/g.13346 Transcript_8615/m.13346 type:complete len:94 (-) Transcript_8615:73-354(-)